MREVRVSFQARPYQQDLIDYFRRGGQHAIEIWHRKAGKDRTATFIESELACKHPGLYWHALPTYEEARKAIWDAITPDGKKLIDVSFPEGIVKKINHHEMKIELVNGSIWQPVGADNYNALVSSFPRHITWSEFALTHPNARNYLRQALAVANGTELIITTPRGYNHAHDLYQYAKQNPKWHYSLLTVDDTGVLSKEFIDEEKKQMPDELFRQEYYCDFSAANVGAILGKYLEQADKDGRITDWEVDKDQAVTISSDIGYRDTASWWFWQPVQGGFNLVDYDEDSGLDADEWIDRLRLKGYKVNYIWLPHDAKAKTFTTQHSAYERFQRAWGGKRVGIVPDTKKLDRYNAARVTVRQCRFHRTNCAAGLHALRSWEFKFDENTKTYSREANHNWASHGGDGYSYGCLVMRQSASVPQAINVPAGMSGVTMEQLWADQQRQKHRRI